MPLIQKSKAWSIIGNFYPIAKSRSIRGKIPIALYMHKDFRLWISRSEREARTGKLISPIFSANSYTGFFVFGYPGRLGNSLYLRNRATGEHLAIKTSTFHQHWTITIIKIPEHWHGEGVQLVAVKNSKDPNGWFGVSTPFSISFIARMQHQLFPYLLPVAVLLVFIAVSLLLFGLGMTIQDRFGCSFSIPTSLFLLFSILCYGLIGYLTFWCYFIDNNLGIAVSTALLTAAFIVYLFRSNRQRLTRLVFHPDVGIPLLMILGAGFLYLMLVYAIRPDSFDWQWTDHVFRRFGVAGDNTISMEFAFRLFTAADLRDHFFGDWLSSDRPPLQAAMVLVQYPLWYLLQKSALIPNLLDMYYQIFCTLLQCSWIAAAWPLMRKLHIPTRRIIYVLLTLIPSGFFFFNTVFVWPKMIAGTFIIGTFCLLLHPKKSLPTVLHRHMLGASLLAVLGFLTHGGVAFSLVGFALMLLFPRNFPGWRNVFLGLLTFIIFYSPWTAYQKYYDPPGNRLLKWHLFGVIDIDQRSTYQTITDVYSRMSLTEFIERRWVNMKTIIGLYERDKCPEDTTLDTWRRYQFRFLLPSLDLINCGWLLFLWVIFGRYRRKPDIYYATARMLAIAILCIGIWVVLLNSEADINHGSYATMIMLFVGLACMLVMLPKWIFIPTMILHILFSFVVWCLGTKPNRLVWFSDAAESLDFYRYDIPMLIIAVLTYFGLIGILHYCIKHHPPRLLSFFGKKRDGL